MASASSSSSSPSHEKYDVFLSFRGEDSRDGFTSHLYAALCRKSIFPFIDDKLERGDEISQSLLSAIKQSRILVVIFSKNYASSRWCLEELVKILDCREKDGQIVIPVFYHVDPSDVRNQTGTFGDAFAVHEERFRGRHQMLKRWRDALTEAANLSGFHTGHIGSESKLIEIIVQDILKHLEDLSASDNKNLVGIALKILEIKSLLDRESDKVGKVGIWGMGGIGKTTIANAIFNKISSQFEVSYFISNVREKSEKRELSHLQKELLCSILGDKDPNIRLNYTKERLRRRRLLIVFDDLTDVKQINDLIGDFENLGLKSRIIVTARDKQVLKNCGLDDATIYEVKGLYSEESLQLFKLHAFDENHPIDKDYMELSNRVISYAKGVPLALEVLGRFLKGRRKSAWRSAFEELESSPRKDIQTVLKISYDGLDDEEKELFLDIACFFEGWDRYLVDIYSSEIRTSVLLDKALITISYGIIRMHDLLREMGREIVQQESKYKVGLRSRLWRHNDVYRVLDKKMGTDAIRGLCFDMVNIKEIHLNPYAFSEMDNLRLLTVNKSKHYFKKVYGFEGLEFDFTELRCLSWDGYPCTSLPLKFCPESLVVLKMRHSNLEELWTGVKDLAHLKYIDLSYSVNFRKVPDLSEAQNLESLILEGCTRLFEITSPSQNLNKLVYLNLRNCKRLISLPIGIQSESLRDVILSGCSKLNTSPRISCNMERLCLDGTAITKLSSSIESPSRLVELNLKDCLWLESLPSSICNLESLQQLNLSGLSNLEFVVGIPCNIKELYLDETAIKELPSLIENVSKLKRLSLRNCSLLESLPDGICKLKSLKYLCISGCSKVESLPEDIGNLERLELLEANGGPIRELPSSMVCLKNLHGLSLERCKIRESSLAPIFSGLRFLRKLNLNHCSLIQLPNNLDQLSLLRDLELAGNNFETLPPSIMNLSNLCILDIRFCDRLQSLPKLPCNIVNLKARDCKLLKSLSGLTIPSYGLCNGKLSFINCFNLDWNAVINIVDDVLLKTFSDRTVWLEVPKGCDDRVGCICFPGSEIPKWFDIQSSEPSIKLPQGSFDHTFLGIVFCVIVGTRTTKVEYELCLKCEDGDKSVDRNVFLVHDPKFIELDHVFVGYNRITCDFCELSRSMEASINFKASNDIKKCGVHLLYTPEFHRAMKRSTCSFFDEEEAHFKRLKSSKFF